MSLLQKVPLSIVTVHKLTDNSFEPVHFIVQLGFQILFREGMNNFRFETVGGASCAVSKFSSILLKGQ
jgi:hypothetical protein